MFSGVFMSLDSPDKRVTPAFTIGITGKNLTDGWGDLGHMFSVATTIKQEFPHCETVFELSWISAAGKTEAELKNAMQRLQILIDKLIYHQFIPERSIDHLYDGQTPDLLVAQINAANPRRFHMFRGSRYEDFLREVGDHGTQLKKVDLWIGASILPEIVKVDPQDKSRSSLVYPDDNIHIFREHGDPSFLDEIHQSGVPLQNIHLMGWGKMRNTNLADPLTFEGEGLFFERLSTDRGTALSEITNRQFNQFLHGKETPLSKQDAFEQIEHTAFIPTYFLRGENTKGLATIVSACAQFYPKSSIINEVIITGNYNGEEIFSSNSIILSKSNIAALIAAGFTEVEFYDAQKQTSLKYPLVFRSFLNTPKGKPNKKKIKILSHCFLSEKDYENWRILAGSLIGCAGDNTLQDAFVQKSVPIFFPHHNKKAEVLENLATLLEQTPHAKKNGQPL